MKHFLGDRLISSRTFYDKQSLETVVHHVPYGMHTYARQCMYLAHTSIVVAQLVFDIRD